MQTTSSNPQEFYDAPSRTATMAMETPQTAETPDLNSLKQLQTSQQRELLDKIDELRKLGLSHHGISLPQLIVCGDQSSGKSSLLEGLTGLRFPTRGAEACTTFACEVMLREAARVEIICSITSGPSRSEDQRQKLREFRCSYLSREKFDFHEVIDQATNKMAFRTKRKGEPPEFYDDILRIEYYGPGLPSLTVVDLPGLFAHQDGGSNNAQRVSSLVKSYMGNSKSVILAVVAAQYDSQLQQVIKYVNNFDAQGTRTFGIITKPDRTERGGPEEKAAISLAKSKKIAPKYGWHVVKNRGPGDENQSDVERDEAESSFFSAGEWATLPKSGVGISTLRDKLARVLLEHIGNELEDLVKAIQAAIKDTRSELGALGKERISSGAQRTYLTEHAERFQTLTNDALRGIYTNPFFDLTAQDKPSSIRLRTEIQNLNIAFAQIMYSKGHTWDISDPQSLATSSLLASATSSHILEEYNAQFDVPEQINRADFLNSKIGEYVRQSRPAGLPSLVNPWVIGEVFRQQSRRWGEIAKIHLQRVFETVETYIKVALGTLDHRTFSMVMLKHVQPELHQKWTNVEAKLQELLIPFTEQDPITYDPGFIREIEETRKSRYRALNSQSGSSGFGISPAQQKMFAFGSTPTGHLLSESLDNFTNAEILDLMQAYYKHAISVFINNIAVLAIENCLIKNFSSIFSPLLIVNLSDAKLDAIAAESAESRDQRESLQKKLEALQTGKDVMNEHIAMRPRVQKPKTTTPNPQPIPNNHRPHTPEPRLSEGADKIALDELMHGMNRLAVTPPESDSGSRSRTPTDMAKSYKGYPVFNIQRRATVHDASDDED